jgi:HAD superfamily hydrolase (TIGR01484 family)
MTIEPRTSLLLASDLDGTLIRPAPGPDPDVAEFAGAFSDRDDLVLAYVTGRHLVHAVEGITGARLPRPHWLACDVGTSVYRLEDGEFRPDPEYREMMAEAFSGLTADEVRVAVSGTHGLRLQAENLQTEFKISFFAPAGPDLPPLNTLAEHILERIGGPEAPVTLVMSREVGTGNLLLDVLPSGVAKHRAVAHIRERVGIADEGVVYAGDSGNDRAAILAGYRSILVGNAPAELREELERALERSGMRDRLYLSEAHFTAGVLEGLRYFGVT